VAIVAKGTDAARAEASIVEVTQLFESLGAQVIQGEPS
jgi:hypothetical protein